jgi:chorismate dehydratase
MSKQKIKVSAVSYLNTIPFIHGIESSSNLMSQIELSRDIPSECARRLMEGEVDLGLIPVAVIPQIREAHIISDYCIGAVGAVQSVLLFSDVPLEEIKSITLDYQSRTSVQLCRQLCQNYWKIHPEFKEANPGYESDIKGKHAGLVIGDRCFAMKDNFSYVYDLAEAWYNWQNLPFVFAAWVSTKELSKEFQNDFNLALQEGLLDLEGAIAKYPYDGLSKEKQVDYLSNAIDYKLDLEKHEGMNLFLKGLIEV